VGNECGAGRDDVGGGPERKGTKGMRLIRTGAMAAATLATAGLVAGGVADGTAWAAKKPHFTCSALDGNIDTNSATLSGCGGNTGGSGTFPPSAFASGAGTITWANGTTTSMSITFKALKKAKGCPSSAYSEYQAKGKTTADTTGTATAGSKVKGRACVDLTTGSLVSPAGGTFQV